MRLRGLHGLPLDDLGSFHHVLAASIGNSSRSRLARLSGKQQALARWPFTPPDLEPGSHPFALPRTMVTEHASASSLIVFGPNTMKMPARRTHANVFLACETALGFLQDEKQDHAQRVAAASRLLANPESRVVRRKTNKDACSGLDRCASPWGSADRVVVSSCPPAV